MLTVLSKTENKTNTKERMSLSIMNITIAADKKKKTNGNR